GTLLGRQRPAGGIAAPHRELELPLALSGSPALLARGDCRTLPAAGIGAVRLDSDHTFAPGRRLRFPPVRGRGGEGCRGADLRRTGVATSAAGPGSGRG